MSTVHPAEIAKLAKRFGQPLFTTAWLDTVAFEPVNMQDRVGEVCMVIRRPNGRLLTAIKTIYPPDAHRLLTGGIRHGEPILEALLREVAEETSLETAVRRLLAVVEYRDRSSGEPVFFTVAFLLDEIGGALACADPAEQHAAFFELDVDQLPAQATVIEEVSRSFRGRGDQDWTAWGRFRAVIHHVVWQALTAPPI